jgi:hypothetical protein
LSRRVEQTGLQNEVPLLRVQRPWRPTLTGWLRNHGSRAWRFPRLHPRLGGVIDRDRFGTGGGELDILWSKMSKKQKNML